MDAFPLIDLSHLLPAVQEIARLPAVERIQRIRTDRWIGYPLALDVLSSQLENLYAWPQKQRMPNLLLIGPTNNGKSMVVERFRRTHPATSSANQEWIPVISVQIPSVSRFYLALLAAIGAPVRPRQRLSEMEQLALSLLRRVGVRILIIDELHNILAGNSVNLREFLNLLRFLGNELRIPIVGVGTRDAYLAIRSDDQLENRFHPVILPLWEADDNCSSLLASFATSLPLRQRSLFEEDVDADIAEISANQDKLLPQTGDEEKTTTRPVRKPLPSHLPRVEKLIPPVESHCPECDEPLHFIRNEVSEKMEYIPARVVVNRYIRPQYSCPCCEKVFSGKMPAHVLPKSAVEPSVIAQVVISKYTDHLPLIVSSTFSPGWGWSFPSVQWRI